MLPRSLPAQPRHPPHTLLAHRTVLTTFELPEDETPGGKPGCVSRGGGARLWLGTTSSLGCHPPSQAPATLSAPGGAPVIQTTQDPARTWPGPTHTPTTPGKQEHFHEIRFRGKCEQRLLGQREENRTQTVLADSARSTEAAGGIEALRSHRAQRSPKTTSVQQGSLSAPYLHSLDLQLHVVLSGRLPVFPLLPAVAIFPVLHFLPVVEYHRAILRSANEKGLR